MELKPIVICNHAKTCTVKDCPHQSIHKVKGWCDCLYRYCQMAKHDGCVCDKPEIES